MLQSIKTYFYEERGDDEDSDMSSLEGLSCDEPEDTVDFDATSVRGGSDKMPNIGKEEIEQKLKDFFLTTTLRSSTYHQHNTQSKTAYKDRESKKEEVIPTTIQSVHEDDFEEEEESAPFELIVNRDVK